MNTNILIVGVGGQGTLLASRVLGRAALMCGNDVKISEVHGMSQRGGSVITYVKYGSKVYSPLIDPGCADYILEERENCLNVFIHASMEKRMERIVQQYGERDETPEHRVKEKDKQRMEYYKYYTGRKWGDVNNYQICLDSGELGIEKCADLICQLY